MQDCKKILIVDDEPDLREILAFYLEDMGFQVSQASGGNPAKETLNNERFDLIVSDVKMPDGSGLELLKHVHGEEDGLKIRTIMVTGFSEISQEGLIAQGAYKVLIKPIEWDSLRPIIEEALKISA